MAHAGSRPHRRKDCGTAQKITIAYYINSLPMDDAEKMDFCLRHPNLLVTDKQAYGDRYFFLFDDNSILGFDQKNSFYITDKWGRMNAGKRPSTPGSHARKVIYS